jgi:uncharacterized membrane protein SpoIIM required for sporulation
MEVETFIRDRQPHWIRLGRLLDDAEAAPDRELGPARLMELLRLYRQACSDLNEARSYTANPELLGRLNDLSARGYRFVYRRPAGGQSRAALRRALDVEVPRAFRRRRREVLSAAGALGLGALVGLLAVFADRHNGEKLIPGAFFAESPKDRVEKIETGEERIKTVEDALHFGASLYTHNIQVSFLAFALGALTVAGGLWLLFYNGVILGAVAAMYALDGVTGFFFAWVGPHGGLEIPAIVFGGAAGLVTGRALLLPGDRSRGAALRDAFPDAWRMMAATALILVIAGLVEGSFSQFSSKTFPMALKVGVAAVLFVSLMGYLFVRRLPEESER